MRAESGQEVDANLNVFCLIEKRGMVPQRSTGNVMAKTCFGVGTCTDIDAANLMRCNSSGRILEVVVDECVFGFDPDLPRMCSHKCSLCL